MVIVTSVLGTDPNKRTFVKYTSISATPRTLECKKIDYVLGETVNNEA